MTPEELEQAKERRAELLAFRHETYLVRREQAFGRAQQLCASAASLRTEVRLVRQHARPRPEDR